MPESKVDLTNQAFLNGREADELRIYRTSVPWDVISAGSKPYPLEQPQEPTQAATTFADRPRPKV
jgi:hypothetical protein